VRLVQVGGRRRIVIPPQAAYGVERFGSIPPNSTLVFEVTILGKASDEAAGEDEKACPALLPE